MCLAAPIFLLYANIAQLLDQFPLLTKHWVGKGVKFGAKFGEKKFEVLWFLKILCFLQITMQRSGIFEKMLSLFITFFSTPFYASQSIVPFYPISHSLCTQTKRPLTNSVLFRYRQSNAARHLGHSVIEHEGHLLSTPFFGFQFKQIERKVIEGHWLLFDFGLGWRRELSRALEKRSFKNKKIRRFRIK